MQVVKTLVEGLCVRSPLCASELGGALVPIALAMLKRFGPFHGTLAPALTIDTGGEVSMGIPCSSLAASVSRLCAFACASAAGKCNGLHALQTVTFNRT